MGTSYTIGCNVMIKRDSAVTENIERHKRMYLKQDNFLTSDIYDFSKNETVMVENFEKKKFLKMDSEYAHMKNVNHNICLCQLWKYESFALIDVLRDVLKRDDITTFRNMSLEMLKEISHSLLNYKQEYIKDEYSSLEEFIETGKKLKYYISGIEEYLGSLNREYKNLTFDMFEEYYETKWLEE